MNRYLVIAPDQETLDAAMKAVRTMPIGARGTVDPTLPPNVIRIMDHNRLDQILKQATCITIDFPEDPAAPQCNEAQEHFDVQAFVRNMPKQVQNVFFGPGTYSAGPAE